VRSPHRVIDCMGSVQSTLGSVRVNLLQKREIHMEKEDSFYMLVLGSKRGVECQEENQPCCA
jgi:hypothetical protein